MKDGNHLPIACGLYIKSEYPDILDNKYEFNCGDKVVDWFVDRVDHYNKLFNDLIGINVPLKENSITPS